MYKSPTYTMELCRDITSLDPLTLQKVKFVKEKEHDHCKFNKRGSTKLYVSSTG